MVAFTPASDVWTLGYDQFDNICWRHKKTQELQYIPPGQPLTLPPRSLAKSFRQNFPSTLPDTATASARAGAYSLQGLGEAIHFNNYAMKVPETARVSPAIFVGYTQPYRLPMSKMEGGKQWLPPRSLEDVPYRTFPKTPYFTTPTTGCAEASSQQGVLFEVPGAARLQPASIIEGTKPQALPPTSTTDEEKHVLPSRNLANAPLPNPSLEPDLTPTTKEYARLPLLPCNDGEKYFDNSVSLETGTAKLRPVFIREDVKPYPPPRTSTAEDEKHGLPPMSSANAPLPNPPYESHRIPTTKDHDREPLLPGGIEEEDSDINSTLELPGVTRVQSASIVDDTKSHIIPPLSEAKNPKLGSTPRSLVNASDDPPFIPAATESNAASLPRADGEQGHLNNNSAPEVPEAVRVRTASIVKDAKPHISVSRKENTDSGLPPTILGITPCSNTPEGPPFTTASSTSSETSFLWEDEGDLFDGNSSLNVPEAVRVLPASIVDTMSHPSHSISRTGKAEQWSRERDIRGKEYYVNIITGESQYKKPDCLKKYARRR